MRLAASVASLSLHFPTLSGTMAVQRANANPSIPHIGNSLISCPNFRHHLRRARHRREGTSIQKAGSLRLLGMRERGKRIGARLTITSSSSGTELLPIVPGRTIYLGEPGMIRYYLQPDLVQGRPQHQVNPWRHYLSWKSSSRH